MKFSEKEISYYQDMHNRLMNSEEIKNTVKEDELAIINECLQNHYQSLEGRRKPTDPLPVAYPLKKQVALRIKFFARCSARYLAEAAYPHTHHNYGMQWAGSDLKIWAAVVLGEVYTEAALIKWGDEDAFWHE